MREKYHCDSLGKPPKAWYVAFDRAVHFGNWELAKELLQEVYWQVHYVKEQMAQGDSGLVTRDMIIPEAGSHGLRSTACGVFYIPRNHPSWSPDLEDSDATRKAMEEEEAIRKALPEKVERIRNGTRPTEILREIMAGNPGASGHQIGEIFIHDLPRVTFGAVLAVGRWNEFYENGCADEVVDRFIVDLMKKAELL